MSDILSIQFNSLPAAVKERFVAITHGASGPQPILWQKTSAKSKVVGLSILAVLLSLVALFVVIVGFGDYSNGLGIHDAIVVIVFYLPVAFLLFYVVLTIAMRLTVGSPFPFQPGRYLFLTDFVDARNGTLRLVPTRLLSDLKAVHMHTNGRYTHTLITITFQGATEQFSITGQDVAQAAVNAFWEGQRQLSAAAQANDWHRVASLDPFFECRRAGVWQDAAGASSGPQVKAVPAFYRWRAAVAAVAAVFICPPVALARNFASDEMMFSGAKAADTERSYGGYIENGWRHVEEAKLARPVAAFREAKQKGTVSEMRRVLRSYAGSSIDADARAALHELYAKTLADFRAKAASTDPRMMPFMERLLSYMEKNDTSKVRVVFSPPSSSALSEADSYFQQQYARMGRIVEPITPYFDQQRSTARELEIVSQLNKAFSSIFPTDVLTLEHGGQDASGSKDPSILIAYSVGPSGNAYGSDDGTRIFVGIDVGFDMKMRIPEDERPFDFKLKVTPPERFGYNYGPGENQAAAAYNAMAQRAFDEFTSKLQAVFFRS